MTTKLEHALALAARGFKIFPIAAGAKAPPLWNDWPGRATTEVQDWPSDGYNIGIHCEGLVVVDVDTKKDGQRALNLLRLTEDLPDTLEAITPSGGQHLFYRLPDGHAGCPNGVDVLGPGLDIRSTGGYVVAAGSQVPAGVYAWRDASAEIAVAPDWLVQRLGQATRRERQEEANIPDASDDVVERARQWLQTAERSVKGAGGDQTAYRVACALRDQGVSYLQACELMRSEAWEYGCGWRDGWLEDKPIRSAYKYAQNDPGVKLVTAAQFQAAPMTAAQAAAMPAPKQRTRVQHAGELAGEPTSDDYVVKHWLTRATYAELFGAPGEGKTFNALDIGFHVATSQPWMGNRVHGGLVLYLAFEGKGGMRKRVKALAKKHGDLGKLYIANASMNLRDVAGRQELGQVLAELPEAPALIVIDTFARALMGGDENSAQDVGAFNNAIEALIEQTQACVLLIHHSGKNKAAGARGSSALLGAIDTELEVDAKQIISRKQRDGENPVPIGFKLTPVTIGMDSDNELMTSCVVEQSAGAAVGSKPLTGKAEHAFSIVAEMTGPSNSPVAKALWIRKMIDEGFSRSTAYHWPRKLQTLGKVMIEDDMVRRRLQ